MPVLVSVKPKRLSLRCRLLRRHVSAYVRITGHGSRWTTSLDYCTRCGHVLDAGASHTWKQRNK